MAKTVDVVALKAFRYRGEPVEAGTFVTMTPIDAAIEARKGTISISKRARPIPPAMPKRRRVYKRRDMQAEDS